MSSKASDRAPGISLRNNTAVGGSRKSSRQNQRYRTRPAPAEEVGLGLQHVCTTRQPRWPRVHDLAERLTQSPCDPESAPQRPSHVPRGTAVRERTKRWTRVCRDVNTSRQLSWPISAASRRGSQKAPSQEPTAAATEPRSTWNSRPGSDRRDRPRVPRRQHQPAPKLIPSQQAPREAHKTPARNLRRAEPTTFRA